MRVAVVGAGGKMGIAACRAIAATDDLELCAAIHPRLVGRSLVEVTGVGGDVVIGDQLSGAIGAGAEVLVDFTTAAAAIAALEFAAESGLHVVSGTTGISPETLERLRAGFRAPGSPNVILAPNFSISAVVLMRLAAICAPHFPMAEIIELHHEKKVDAPSGTALETARAIAEAREASGAGDFVGAAPASEVLAGARGAKGPAGVRLHAVRLAGLLAHEEVIFGAPGQTLTLRQDTLDREAYMPGVLLAIRAVSSTPGVTIGLGPLLGI